MNIDPFWLALIFFVLWLAVYFTVMNDPFNDDKWLTPSEANKVLVLVDAEFDRWLYHDAARFAELMNALDMEDLQSSLQLALANLDKADSGDLSALQNVILSMLYIRQKLKTVAWSLWRDELREKAIAKLGR